MYSLRVETAMNAFNAADDKDDDERPDVEEVQDAIEFSVGNPRVEHTLGVVHLYRHMPSLASKNTGQCEVSPKADSTHGVSAADLKPKATGSRQLQGLGARAPGTAAMKGSKEAEVSESAGSSQHVVDPPPSPTNLLCCLAIPADMSVAEFCKFCGAYLEQIRHMRVLRRETSLKVVSMILIQFSNPEHASAFYRDYNNKAFSSLEPDILCRLVHVRDVEIKSGSDITRVGLFDCSSSAEPNTDAAGGSDGGGAGAQPISTHPTELPTCPVCLERLDEHISGIVITVCNHRFHSECLQKWGDTSCPVCRYCSLPSTHNSRCNVCGTPNDLWICLICGHVGCGRYREGHAVDHWKSSDHCFALELETQAVWDYAGDNYVHRLIQSKSDGKLVEVPSPQISRQQHRGTGSSGRSMDQGGWQAHGDRMRCASGHGPCHTVSEQWHEGDQQEDAEDEELKEAMMASKLDHISAEYNHLLASQLDSQRQYFEGLLAQAAADAEQQEQEMSTATSMAVEAARAAEAAAKEADRKRLSAEKKLADHAIALTEAQKETAFLKSLGDSLLSNQKEFQEQLKQAREELAAKDVQVKDLQEQVRDLMVYIEASRAVNGECSEIKDATILPMPEAQEKPGRRSKAKGKGK